MRFGNRTSIDQVVKTFRDPRNPKTIVIAPGEEVEGSEYESSGRPVGPLTPVVDETVDRKQFQRVTTHNVRDILRDHFESVMSSRLKGRQASTTQSIAPLVGLFRSPSFGEFCNERTLVNIINSTLSSDTIGVIIARLEAGLVMHHIKETVSPDKSTTWTAGLSLNKESWRHTHKDDGAGTLRKRDGYVFDPQQPQPAPTNFSPADLSAWSQLVRQHRDLIVDAIAQAIFTYVKND